MTIKCERREGVGQTLSFRLQTCRMGQQNMRNFLWIFQNHCNSPQNNLDGYIALQVRGNIYILHLRLNCPFKIKYCLFATVVTGLYLASLSSSIPYIVSHV